MASFVRLFPCRAFAPISLVATQSKKSPFFLPRSYLNGMYHLLFARRSMSTVFDSTTLPPPSKVTPSSANSIKKPAYQKQLFTLDEKDIEESFSRGSGPGGQSVNKTQNKVRLVHTPTSISVYCHEARDLSTNKRLARRLLRDKVELHLYGDQSKISQRFDKLRERKHRASRRSKKKYHPLDKDGTLFLSTDLIDFEEKR